MYSVTRLLDVAEADRDRVLDALRAPQPRAPQRDTSSSSRRCPASATAATSWCTCASTPKTNGGPLKQISRRHWRDPAITRVNGAGYSGDASRTRAPTAGTVYRALLLRVLPGTDADTVARFEDELRLMPRYVNTITAWQLSRVDEPVGTSEWTHVFEQEFTDLDGLMGPYLMHPIHWAVVDRWFDPECPDVIIQRPGVPQLLRAATPP